MSNNDRLLAVVLLPLAAGLYAFLQSYVQNREPWKDALVDFLIASGFALILMLILYVEVMLQPPSWR